MAKQISWGYNDTPTGGAAKTLARSDFNYMDDFRCVSEKPGEVIITNITSPLDRPEQIRYATSNVANVYAGTSIDESVYAPSKRGVSLLAQVTETVSVTDDADADFRIDLPLSAHLVIKTPASEHISADMVATLVGRLVGSLFESDDTTNTRLDAMLRGSLQPKGL